MKSLRFRTSCLAMVGATVAVMPLLGSGSVGADPVEDQRQRVEQITDQLEELERQADILAEDYVVAMDEWGQLKDDVSAAEESVAEQQEAVEVLQGQLGDVAVQAYMGAGSNGLGPIFTDATQFNDELQRDELTRAALNTGTADSDDLDRELNELAEAQEVLESQRDAAAEKAEDVEAAKEATEEQTAEYQEARVEAEAELGDLIREEEERRARESWERMQREAAAAQAQAEADAAAAEAAQQRAATAEPSNSGGSTSGGGNNSGADNSGADNSGGSSSGGSTTSSGGGGGSTSSGGGGSSSETPAPSGGGGGGGGGNIPAASSRAGTAVNAAMSEQGTPYKYASASPGVAFDCSGLTSWAWGRAGVSLPHQSRAQYASVPHVPSSAAQPGDLVFFYSPISHVGIYLGGGQMIHSPNSGSVVSVTTVNWGNVVGVGRPG